MLNSLIKYNHVHFAGGDNFIAAGIALKLFSPECAVYTREDYVSRLRSLAPDTVIKPYDETVHLEPADVGIQYLLIIPVEDTETTVLSHEMYNSDNIKVWTIADYGNRGGRLSKIIDAPYVIAHCNSGVIQGLTHYGNINA